MAGTARPRRGHRVLRPPRLELRALQQLRHRAPPRHPRPLEAAPILHTRHRRKGLLSSSNRPSSGWPRGLLRWASRPPTRLERRLLRGRSENVLRRLPNSDRPRRRMPAARPRDKRVLLRSKGFRLPPPSLLSLPVARSRPRPRVARARPGMMLPSERQLLARPPRKKLPGRQLLKKMLPVRQRRSGSRRRDRSNSARPRNLSTLIHPIIHGHQLHLVLTLSIGRLRGSKKTNWPRRRTPRRLV